MIRVLGCGEAFDTGLGNNSCLLYDGARGRPAARKRCPTVLFDCGYQVPERLWRLPRIYPGLDAVVLTHFHADHAFGLGPLLVRFAEEKRTAPLCVFGSRGIGIYFRRLLDLAYPGMRFHLPFEVRFCELEERDSVEWEGLTLSTARSRHSVLNLAVRVEGRGISFAVSGDGQLTDATRELYAGVQLLLHEVYTVDERLDNHCDLGTLSAYVAGARIARVGITHVRRTDKKKMRQAWQALKKARASKRTECEWMMLKPATELEAA
jgi:ribonuclease BN (tRNA processing enzyme)